MIQSPEIGNTDNNLNVSTLHNIITLTEQDRSGFLQDQDQVFLQDPNRTRDRRFFQDHGPGPGPSQPVTTVASITPGVSRCRAGIRIFSMFTTSGTPINILHGICMVYTIHIPCILHSAGIYMVYTMDIHSILKCYILLFFRILLLGTHDMGVYKAMYTPENFKTAYSSFKSCKHECMVYTWYIPDIYMEYTIHIPGLVICKFCQLTKKHTM